MGGFDDTFQLVSCDQRYVAACSATDYDHFTVFDYTVHERFELLTCLAVGYFNGHGRLLIGKEKLYRLF
jgi:hypothetical protein